MIKMKKIKQIFQDHWEGFVKIYKPRIRKNVLREVNLNYS
ncbi:hypothetical protein SAMN02745912_02137 [Paramaledivibacter caminithermalis DSM 15212]|jgi:hypothetical protein|uniref:Uncharacterized protein n=1 Tax=Paramaledivibacter caminithermalis (strain DSM 15212 / CIP 107654 / DViRD3) TaxID=1121301 RepID=A0A1M6PEP6_PARC5|nr:hypothetical protein SAMN02745912_02137 [Paramaledivibacter caminithermalis DSM 15212]